MKDYEFAEEFCGKMRQALNAAIAGIREDLLTEVRTAKSLRALSQAIRNLSTRNGDIITLKMVVDGQQVYTMEAVSRSICIEMITNYNSADAEIVRLMNQTWLQPVGKLEAYAMWWWKVRSKGDWDHKPDIFDPKDPDPEYGRFCYDSVTKRVYIYDIWSNIHYGFVGAAAAFSSFELTAGAAAANVFDSLGYALFEYGQGDDPRDQVAIQLGIDLWRQYGERLDLETPIAAIRDKAPLLTTFECDVLSNLMP